ncbi:alpha/beta fold hydrolase [Pseudomonas sp.]|uniref:alpha/beta fold hydrolase n=1 Tax=Pseudomonas sp. TaxID=306 RepID=UPI00272CB149|nr:alpha/beta hydrolase [Pseudomonas sp.]
MARFRASDGVEIYYQEWGRGGASPPVVLHHGYVAHARANWVWPGIVRRLTAAGRRVIALDARGHGRSGKPHDPAYYGEARMAEDVSTLLDVLGLDEVDLVGYSMGAVVSLIVGSQEPRIRRLVVAGIGGNSVRLPGMRARPNPRKAISDAMLARSIASVRNPALVGFRLMADMLWADRRALAAQAAAFHGKRIPLERITAPTLVLAGRDDPFAARPNLLQQAIPDSRLITVPGNHTTALTKSAFREAIAEFLR